jgi:hypothetical protein
MRRVLIETTIGGVDERRMIRRLLNMPTLQRLPAVCAAGPAQSLTPLLIDNAIHATVKVDLP